MTSASPSVPSQLLIMLLSATLASATNNGGQPAVKLVNNSTTFLQSSDTEWTLKKTCEVDASGKTVTWAIAATGAAP